MSDVQRQKVNRLTVVTAGVDNPNARAVRATIVGITKQIGDVAESESAYSKQLSQDDPWATLVNSKTVVEPPLDPLPLSMLIENNSELQPTVEAMEVNIEGFGHRIVPVTLPQAIEANPEILKTMEVERIKLANFFNNCCFNSNFISLRRLTRRDLELTGNGYWEIIEDTQGAIRWLEWAPAWTVRLTPLDTTPVMVEVPQIEVDQNGVPVLVKVKRMVRFRRFIQIREGQKVYFKQLGDPRNLNCETGEYSNNPIEIKYRANSMHHFRIPSARTPYGLPRFIGNLFSIFGSRAAEEINYTTLKNNNVPSMVVTVSGGGMLTTGTIKRIEQFVESNIKGSSNYSKFLILEAEPVEVAPMPGQSDAIKISITPLTNQQIKDAMFQSYDANNRDKVRGAFRLPPIFVGKAEDYSRATAEASRQLADEQVFAPERTAFDAFMNSQILPRLGIVYHRFISNGPNVTDSESLTKMLAASEGTGGLTPQIARNIMSDIFGTNLGKVTAIDPDVPFTIQVAEAAKNTGPINMGTIAPMKSIVQKAIIDGGDVVQALMALRTAVAQAIIDGEDIK